MRTRAYRRAVRDKWINRRMFIMKNIWLDKSPYPLLRGGGRLAKYNFAHGSCFVCGKERYRETRHLTPPP